LKSLAETGVKGMTSAEDAQTLFDITTKIAAGNTIIVYIAGGMFTDCVKYHPSFRLTVIYF
jgi:hypothetical protein